MRTETLKLSAKQLLEDLSNGYTRTPKTKHYEAPKSIQEKYGLTPKELEYVFSHPKLKYKKTKKVFNPNIVIEDFEDPKVEGNTKKTKIKNLTWK